MRKFTETIVDFMNDDDAVTSTEYAVMAALVIVVCLGALAWLGVNASSLFDQVGSQVGN